MQVEEEHQNINVTTGVAQAADPARAMLQNQPSQGGLASENSLFYFLFSYGIQTHQLPPSHHKERCKAARRHMIQASGLLIVQGSYYCDEGENLMSDQNVQSTATL